MKNAELVSNVDHLRKLKQEVAEALGSNDLSLEVKEKLENYFEQVDCCLIESEKVVSAARVELNDVVFSNQVGC